MDKSSRTRWFPWVFPRSPKLRVLTLYVVAPVVAIVGVAAAAVPIVADGGSDDDRPPIIVTNGSVVFYDGDPQDVFQHWLPWKPDGNGSARWRPDHPKGKSIKSFKVVITGVQQPPQDWPPACSGIMSGRAVDIEFKPDNTSAVHFSLSQDTTYGFLFITSKTEPVLDPPAGVSVTQGNVPSQPPTLTFGSGGSITTVTVGATACPIPQSSDVKANLAVHIKPSPEEVKGTRQVAQKSKKQ